ncbi:MAG: GNAT family N-acetyltransferase [Anaerolineae bacterium]|nr:GNAT family N-acetyltransferase [Anaerolineae bacterium]
MTRTREREKPELFTLHNGKTVTIRRLEPTDAPHLIDVFDHLSADSRYHRFNVVLDHPDPAYVRQQAEMIAQSVVNGRGFLAFDGPDPVGGARYVRVDDDSAEIALSFRDDYQAQGLGTHLLRKLVQTAREDGYTYLIGIAQDGNKGLWALLDKIDEPFTRTPDHGFSSFTITL